MCLLELFRPFIILSLFQLSGIFCSVVHPSLCPNEDTTEQADKTGQMFLRTNDDIIACKLNDHVKMLIEK